MSHNVEGTGWNCITLSASLQYLSDRADIILLQVPLANSICLSGTRFIHHWKQEGFRTRGRSLRMTLYKGIAKHSSSQSPAMTFY